MNARSLFTPVFRSLFGVWLCFSVWSAGTALAVDYTVTTTVTAITVTDNSGNGDTLTVSQPNPGKIRFAATGTVTRTFSVNGAANTNDNSGDLNLPTTLTNVTVNTAGGDDTVTFSGNLTLPANTSLDLDLQNDGGTVGADRITFADNAKVALSGTGSATLKVSRDIVFNIGSGLSTVNGALTLEANQQAVATPGSFNGVNMDGTVQATGPGVVTVRGKSGTGESNIGISIYSQGSIAGGTAGVLLVQGISNASSGTNSFGFFVAGEVSSNGADVVVEGTGGKGGGYDAGACINGGAVKAGGGMEASVTVRGTGTSLGGSADGVWVRSTPGSQITSDGGDIFIEGVAGPGSASQGIVVGNRASIITSSVNGGNITLTGDSMSFDYSTNISVISANASSKVTLKPKTASWPIVLGKEGLVEYLEFLDVELDLVNAGTIVIGDSDSGSILVDGTKGNITRPAATNMQLISGGDISFTTGAIDTAGGTLTLDSGASPAAVKPGKSGTDATASTVTLASGGVLSLAINGSAVDTGYQQLKVTGAVNLTGTTLTLTGTRTPEGADSFTLVDNDGTDPITGTFIDLAEGAGLTFNDVPMVISYTGGDGNDVVLSCANTAPTISDVADTSTNEDTATAPAITFTVGDDITASGSLTVTADSTNTGLVPVANIVFGGSGADRTATITPAANQSGTTTITLTVTDGGGLTTSDTFVLTVNAVNDAPTLAAIADAAINEDAGEQTVNLSGISMGNGDSGQILTVTASSGNTALIATPVAVTHTSPNATGSLKYTPVTGVSGTAVITVTVKDNGGTANGGIDTVTRTFTVNVNAVNDAPTLTTIPDQSVPFGGSASAQDFSIGDAETADTSLTVTAVSDNATLVPNANIALGGSGADRTVTVTPVAGQNGTAQITVSVSDGTAITKGSFQFTVAPPADYIVASSGGNLSITDNTGNGDTLTVSEPGAGKIRFAAPGRTFSVNGAATTPDNSGDLDLTGITQVTVNAGAGADTLAISAFPGTFPASLTLNGGTGDDTVNFNGSLTFATDRNLDVDLQNDEATVGSDRVDFAANAKIALSGIGTATVKASRDIVFSDSSGLSTVNGALTVEANQQTPVTNGAFTGIQVGGSAVIEATGTGPVTLKGQGGNDSINEIFGILNSGTVRGGTIGTLLVQGVGGPGAGRGNRGLVQGSVTALISSYGADVTLKGTAGSGAYSDGCQLAGSITAGGTGAVRVEGTASGTATEGGHTGIYLNGANITSSGGNVMVVGTGAGGAGARLGNGLLIYNSTVSAGGMGSLLLQGMGGAGGLSKQNQGIALTADSVITTGGGDITLTGGSASAGDGAFHFFGSVTSATNGGNITLSADFPGFYANVTAKAGNTVTIKPRTAGWPVNLGTFSTAAALGLSDGDVARLNTDHLVIGDSATGPVTVAGDISRAALTNMELHSGADISFTSGKIDTLGGTLLLDSGLSPDYAVKPAVSGTDATASTVSFGADDILALKVTSASAYETLTVAGAVDLTATSLKLSGSHTPAGADSFTLVNNDGSDAITGTFADLPEGAGLTFNTVPMVISYTGGDGNDVVLSRVNQAPTISDVADTSTNEDTATAPAITFTVGDDITAPGSLTMTVTGNTNPALVPNDSAHLAFSGGGAGRTLTITPAENLSGQTTLTLTVTDGSGLTATDTFELTVNAVNDAPAVTALADQRVPHNSANPGETQDFTVGDVETPAADLTVTAVSDNAALVPNDPANITLGGAGEARTITITPVTGQSGTAEITVSVDDGSGGADAVTTETFQFTVDPVPDYTVTVTDSAITVTDMAGNGDTLAVSQLIGDGGAEGIVFAAPGRTFSVNGALNTLGDSGGVSLTVIATVTVNAAGGNDLIDIGAFTGSFPGLTLNGGTGDDTVNFNGSLTFATDRNLDVDLQNDDATPGIDRVGITDNVKLALSDTGAATLKASRDISFNSGSGLTTENGSITLEANRQATPAAGGFNGITLAPLSWIQVTGTGAITLKGTSGDLGRVSGISLAGRVLGGRSSLNPVLIQGMGVASTGSAVGVDVAGGQVNSSGASVRVEGLAGGANTSGGIGLSSGSGLPGLISAGGMGEVTVIGAGGPGSKRQVSGITLNDGTISSSGGDVTVHGVGPAQGTFGSRGVVVITSPNSRITAGGKGVVRITGEGGGASGSGGNQGLYCEIAHAITSGGGDIFVTAGKGAGSGNAIDLLGTGGITTLENGGNITLTSDSLGWGASDAVVADASSAVTLKPKTAGFPITLGGGGNATRLGMTDGLLDRVSAGTILIGEATTGPVTVEGDISRAALTNMELHSGADISFTTGKIDTLGGTLLLDSGAAPAAVKPQVPGTDITASGTGFGENGGDLLLRINGNAPNTAEAPAAGYDQLKVAGAVDLTHVTLVLSGNYTPVGVDRFVLVDKDGADPITGEFAGLPEGGAIDVKGVIMRMTYRGGDGNDAVLTLGNGPPAFTGGPDLSIVFTGLAVQSFPHWATNIDDGDAGVTQALTFNVTVLSGGSILAGGAAPSITGDGRLDFALSGTSGMATLSVTLTDDSAPRQTSAPRTFTIMVNNPPVAGPDILGTVEDTPATVTARKFVLNDSDRDGDAISITAVSAAGGIGQVSLGGGKILYTPAPGFSGADRFTYTLTDARGATATGVVSVTVTPKNAISQNSLITPTADGFSLRFAGIPGESYRIEYSADLTRWEPLTDPVTADAQGAIRFTDSPHPRPERRFYRTVPVPSGAGAPDGPP